MKYYDIIKIYSVHFHLMCSVNLSYLYFFMLGFQSSILHKLKSTLNCRLKLNNDNRSFLVAYSASIKWAQPSYKNKSCSLKLLKYKLQKILNIVKCSRNFSHKISVT